VRLILLVLGPVVLLGAALAFYLSGGRYVSEENAYVQAATVVVTPEVAGHVKSIAVRDNQAVKAGDPLLTIDPEPYRIALANAEAQLGVTRDQLAGLVASYAARQAQVQQAEAGREFAEADFQRVHDLERRGVSSQAQLDQAQRNLRVAETTLTAAQQDAAAVLAQLGGDGNMPVEQRSQYKQAEANVDAARRNLRLSDVRASLPGVVTNVHTIEVGSYLTPGQTAMNIISDENSWIEANLKESDLTDVRVGQPVSFEVDAYPGRTFQGKVSTIDPASGATFALLPPQNASGNWVKVVQRIPVQIAITQTPAGEPLRAGMSATISIDTGRQRSLSGLLGDIWPR